MESSIFEAAGGAETFAALARAWHQRVMADPVVSQAFSHGLHPRHGERSVASWTEALGGPREYSRQYGDESFVLRLHSGNGEHEEMDRRAAACFAQALDDVDLPASVRQPMLDYFTWATGEMATYPESPEDVPAGLAIPRWSWDGRVG